MINCLRKGSGQSFLSEEFKIDNGVTQSKQEKDLYYKNLGTEKGKWVKYQKVQKSPKLMD